MILHGKNKIEGGKWCNIPVDCTDILPTIVEAAGHSPKRFYDEIGIDGRSILGLSNDVENENKTYTKDIRYWHYPFNVVYHNPYDGLPLTPHSAIREWDFKLIWDWHGRLKLFNIAEDISEKNNLAKQMPEKTEELFKKLVVWLKTNVNETYWPKENPKYNPENEAHDEPFVDLLEVYRKGGNVVEKSN